MVITKKNWGPVFWDFLHLTAVNLRFKGVIPYENQQQLINLFNNLGVLIPCKKCALHYDEYLTDNPIEKYVENKRRLSYWVYKLHNVVNDRLDIKETSRPSFDQVTRKYENYTNAHKKLRNYRILVLVLTIILLSLLLKLCLR